jgi:hypothetical protein
MILSRIERTDMASVVYAGGYRAYLSSWGKPAGNGGRSPSPAFNST